MIIKIIDSVTGAPMQGATLQFNKVSASSNPDQLIDITTLSTAQTGANGTVNYTGAANQLKITFAGYKPKTIDLAGRISTIVTMEPNIKETNVTITAAKRPSLILFALLLLAILYLMYKYRM